MESAPNLEDLFAAALEQHGADRQAFVDRVCAGNPALGADLTSLLESHDTIEAGGADILPAVSEEARAASALMRARSLASGHLGRYAVDRFLAEGATSRVYRAVDTRTGRIVALKVGSSRTILDPDGRRRFEQSAVASVALDHPHIARVFEAGVEEDLPYVAMEFVEGVTLAEYLRTGRPGVARALGIAGETAQALASAHAAGIIHRDLKPGNIMVGADGNVKVLDFGLCHAVAGRATIADTRTGAMLGTPGYTAPELAYGEQPSPASDIFSLGAVLSEMLAGAAPFRGPTAAATVSSVLHAAPAPLRNVPSAIQRLVENCLEKAPSRRPASAGDVADTLARLERELAAGKLPVRPVWDSLRARARAIRLGPAVALAAGALAVGGIAVAYSLRTTARVPDVRQITTDYLFDTEPALSHDRKWVAFASDRSGEGNLDLWIAAVSGGAPRRLTRHEINIRQPEFSPDGRTLLYRSDRAGGGIFEIAANADAAAPATLVAAGGLGPKYSPDGKFVAYWNGFDGSGDVFAPGASRVYVQDLKGGKPSRICPEFSSAAYPIWSPDGRSVMFLGRRSAGSKTETLVWMTPIDACRALPVGERSDLGGISPQPEVTLDRWLPGGRLLFRQNRGPQGLFEFRFSPATGARVQPIRHIPQPVSAMRKASVLDESTMAYAVTEEAASLWSIPLDSSGQAAGPSARALGCSSALCIPAVSPDGKVLFYSRIDTRWEMVRRDWAGAVETSVERSNTTSPWIFLTGPEQDMVFSQQTGAEEFMAVRVSARNGARQTLCEHCAELWDVSPDGRYLLAMAGVTQRTVDLIDTASRQTTSLLRHTEWNLYRASFSPDQRSVVFTAKMAPDRAQILVADFRNGVCAPTREWVAVSGGAAYDGPAHWSPGGDRIYFTSTEDGHRCFYMRRWDKQRHIPIGPVVAVRHFHGESESPGLIAQSVFGFAVARDKIVFEMGRQFGNIWCLR